MQQLNVSIIKLDGDPSIEHIAVFMDGMKKHRMDFAPWDNFPYKPEVLFNIGYGATGIYLKYTVSENSIRAANHCTNGPVWEDSCVEFFLALDAEGYYNFEFNCIGTTLAAFGKEREHRSLIPENLVQGIRSYSVIRRHEKAVSWELTLQLPFSLFAFHDIRSLEGRKARGNFYKCGDKLREPHFICWNAIEATTPDFHLPQYFGDIHFKPAGVIR